MEYKVLIKVFFPLIETSFEVYIPTTRSIQYVSKLLQKAVQENYNKSYKPNPKAIICNKTTGQIYDTKKLIIDTDIRNGTKICIL